MLKDSVVIEIGSKAIKREIIMLAEFTINPNIETKRQYRVAKSVADTWRVLFDERNLKPEID
jgi:hypothetical protein